MAKKVHMLVKGSAKERKGKGRSICGSDPRSKGKGTIIWHKVTCSMCLRKIDQMTDPDVLLSGVDY